MNDLSPNPAHPPAIVAPLSRHLSVADVDRSAAFFRDVPLTTPASPGKTR